MPHYRYVLDGFVFVIGVVAFIGALVTGASVVVAIFIMASGALCYVKDRRINELEGQVERMLTAAFWDDEG